MKQLRLTLVITFPRPRPVARTGGDSLSDALRDLTCSDVFSVFQDELDCEAYSSLWLDISESELAIAVPMVLNFDESASFALCFTHCAFTGYGNQKAVLSHLEFWD